MPSALRRKFFRTDTDHVQEGTSDSVMADLPASERPSERTDDLETKAPAETVGEPSDSETTPNEQAQDGVTNAEAITLTWTKKSLAVTYIL